MGRNELFRNCLLAASLIFWTAMQPGLAISSLPENTTGSEWIEECVASPTEVRAQEKKSVRLAHVVQQSNQHPTRLQVSIASYTSLPAKAPWHRLHEKWLI